MAFIYKLFLRREGKRFVLCQNGQNSATSTIGIEDSTGWAETIATIHHPTKSRRYKVVWEEDVAKHNLKEKTKEELQVMMNNIFQY